VRRYRAAASRRPVGNGLAVSRPGAGSPAGQVDQRPEHEAVQRTLAGLGGGVPPLGRRFQAKEFKEGENPWQRTSVVRAWSDRGRVG